MGLGPGEISVMSLLSKSGLVPHSFSFCYDKSYSGRLYFGDQGPASQRSTSFVHLKGNRYLVFMIDFDIRKVFPQLTLCQYNDFRIYLVVLLTLLKYKIIVLEVHA